MVSEIPGAMVILTGDLNANPNTAEGQKLPNFSKVNVLTIHISELTRIISNSRMILDQLILKQYTSDVAQPQVPDFFFF